MSGGEEDEKEFELKDLIVQTLEANGLLSKLKAQIRASVFMALDESDKNTQNLVIQNPSVKKVLASPDGRVAASLVREFLEKCNLDFTLSVFDPELNSTMLLDKREKLVNSLKTSGIDRDTPVLVEFVKSGGDVGRTNGHREHHELEGLSESIIDAIKARFDRLDENKRGLIDDESVKVLFFEFFPNFSKNILDTYIDEEISETRVDFNKFLTVLKKWHLKCQHTAFDTETHIGVRYKANDSSLRVTKENTSNNLYANTNDHKKNSTIKELPSLFGSFGGNNNKKIDTNATREFDKKFNNDDNYDEDFTNSAATPRTPKFERKNKNRSGIISDEEIDENLSYIEESSKIDEVTVDRSISTIQGANDADYIEDVSI